MGMQEVAIKLNLDSSSFLASAQNVADAFGKINEKLAEASKMGNADDVERYTKMAANLQHVYTGMASGASGAGGGAAAGGGAVGTVHGGASAINQAVTQAGHGDVLGAGISGAKGGLDVVGRISENTAKAAGIAGLALIPAMIGNTLTNFYEQQMKSAMDINAMLRGTERQSISDDVYERLSETQKADYEKSGSGWIETEKARTQKNSDNINDAFKKAADAAIEFGYSMEEGMALVKSAMQYGFTEKNIDNAERNVFSWARTTAIDPETLMRYRGSRHRYGDDSVDPLAATFKINTEMGMGKGQFRETLDALQGVLEDGLSKGFVKGTAETGAMLVGLYKDSGGSKLWQGEQGAQRLMTMNTAIAGATSLGSVTDVLAYRAASDLSQEAKSKALTNAGITGSYGYIDTMIALEQGVSGDMLANIKKQVEGIAGIGNKEGQIEYYKNLFGMNYSGGTQIYEILNNKGSMSTQELEKKIKEAQSDPRYLSDQKKALQTSEHIRESIAHIGKDILPIKTMAEKALLNAGVNLGAYAKGDISGATAAANIVTGDAPDNSWAASVRKQIVEKTRQMRELQVQQKNANVSGGVSDQGMRDTQDSIISLTQEIQILNQQLKNGEMTLTQESGKGKSH